MSTKAVISITPVFTLRRIDPREIYEKYLRGGFSEMTIPKEKIQVNSVPATVEPSLGSSPNTGLYSFRLKNNTLQVIATSNSVPFTFYMENGDKLPTGGTCGYCGREFQSEALGIPTQMREIYSPAGPELHCYMDDCCYCSFECVFAGWKSFHRGHARYHDPLYMDSEQILRYIYSLAYPNGGILRAAPDRRLSTRFNGPLNDEAFHSKKHTYCRLPNVIMAPVKVQYQRSVCC